jgi:Subtilase family
MQPRRPLASSLALGVLWACSAFAAETRPRDVPRERLVSLTSARLDVAAPPKVPQTLRAGAEGYFLVKYPGPVDAARHLALENAVERIYTYLPYETFLVKARDLDRPEARRELGALWIGPYHPAYKLAPAVAAVTEPATGRPEGPLRIVMLLVYPDADLAGVRGALAALGVKRIVGAGANPFFSRMRLLLDGAEVVALREALARIPEVFWVGIEGRKALVNDTTIWVGQSGVSGGQATPVFGHGIHGEGQVIGIIDTGIDADMCYFRDPAQGLPPQNVCNGGTLVNANERKLLAVDFLWTNECAGGITNTEWDTHGHGTHVAGTAAGDNFANPIVHDPGDGMAPGAKLVMQDGGYQVDPCADLPGIGCPVVDLNPLFQQAYDQGARLHTNSYGDQEDTFPQNNYTAASQDVDEFMWNHKDFQIFFAAGNSGPGSGSVGSPSTAKDVISVGATHHGSSAEGMASFSSCGPTDDNRIKPDLTIPGESVVSAGNDFNVTTNNCGEAVLSGTSMASPAAAGFGALARQYYADGFYPSGVATPADAFAPSAALVKATLLNSAQNMTGVAQPIPSNCQGWGRILLDNGLYFPGDARRLWVSDDSVGFPMGSSGETRSYDFSVNSASVPFKVSLVWTDFPSTPAADPHLNDDLDLEVVGPGGTFLGNVFSGGQSTAGGSPDQRNTVEQVLRLAPAPGPYTVSVRSVSVPDGPQPFALVVTGDITPAVPVELLGLDVE